MRDCEKDWCTHCLHTNFLVLSEDGTYHTVIDQYEVTMDESYYDWQRKCPEWDYGWGVFTLQFGAMLIFKDSEIVDVRYRPENFVYLEDAAVRLERTNVLRADVSNGFIYASGNCSLALEDCCMTGLNRDHAYITDYGSDGSFLQGFGHTNLTVLNSHFFEMLAQEYASLIFFNAAYLTVANTRFSHCTGSVSFSLLCSDCSVLFSNLTFQTHFSITTVFSAINFMDVTAILMVDCLFSDNVSVRNIAALSDVSMQSVVFRNNRGIGQIYPDFVYFSDLIQIFGDSVNLLNCVFENNGAFRQTIDPYWIDYYISKGLLESSAKAPQLTRSACLNTVFLLSPNTNVTSCDFTENSGVCNATLALQDAISEAESLYEALLSNVSLSSTARFGLTVLLRGYQASGTVRVENSVLKHSATLLTMEVQLTISRVHLVVASVSFEQASGSLLLLAPVTLLSVQATLTHCHWHNNSGAIAGALAAFRSTVTLQHCRFTDDYSWAGPGDLYLEADNNTFISVKDCVFVGSRSALTAAAILLLGNAIDSMEIISCMFRESSASNEGIIKTAHNIGSVWLRNLTFESTFSETTSLIVSTASQTCCPVTVIEDLKVINSRFHRGIMLMQGLGPPTVRAYHSLFRNSTGSAIWIESGNFTDTDSLYEHNSGTTELYYQGANTFAYITSSVYRANSPSEAMGLLHIEGRQAIAVFQECTIKENVSTVAAEVMQVGEEGNVTLSGCIVAKNEVHTAVIHVKDSSLFLLNCSFIGNSDLLKLDHSQTLISFSFLSLSHSSLGTLFIYHNSSLSLLRSSVREVSGAAGCVLAAQDSVVLLDEVEIAEVVCDTTVIFLQNCLATMQRGTMKQTHSNTTVMSVLGNVFFLASMHISQISGQTFLSLANTTASLSDVELSKSTVQVIQCEVAAVTLDSCVFQEVTTSRPVGVLFCEQCGELNVRMCMFERVRADSVAGISGDFANVTVLNSTFRGLRARETGAMRISTPTVLISASTFYNNSATGALSSGGAMHVTSSHTLIHSSAFTFNSAIRGGAVYWTKESPNFQNCSFNSNYAIQGADKSSVASRLRSLNNSLSLASGQLFQDSLLVWLQDDLGQYVSADNDTSAELSAPVIGSEARTVASKGKLIFTGFSAIGQPGSAVSGKISTATLSLALTFLFRECESGEMQVNGTCERCAAEHYSLSPASICDLCLPSAECRHGLLYPRAGFWRPNLFYEGVFSCPRSRSCLGHEDFSSETGACEKFYEGNLCQSCAEGAGRRGRDRCTECFSTIGLKAQTAILGVGLPVLWLGLAYVTSGEGRAGALLRIFMDYTQLMVLVSDFDLDWPEPLEYFGLLHEYLGSAGQLLLQGGCATSESFFTPTLAAVISPMAISAALALFWLASWVLSRVFSLPRLSTSSASNFLLVGIFYLHPYIVRTGFSAFLCETIEAEDLWLRAEMRVRCWDKKHTQYSLAASLPAVLLWGCGIPTLSLLLLVRYSKRPHKPPRAFSGFLCSELKKNRYFWIVGIAFGKAGLSVLHAFLGAFAKTFQALTLVLYLAILAWLQLKAAPYTEVSVNRVERASFVVVLSTAYTGLYFCTAAPSSVLLAVTLLLHLAFLLLWLTAICLHIKSKIK